MTRLEKQYLLMAAASTASLVVFFAYFFSPRGSIRVSGALVHPPAPAAGEGAFVPVSAEKGIAFHHQQLAELPDIAHITGSGVCLGDFDGDGRTDVYLINSSPPDSPSPQPCVLYLNQGGGRFAEVRGAWGADVAGLNMGGVCADYDNDGDLDIYVTRVGPDRLFRNEGRRFVDVTQEAGIHNPRWGSSAAFADYDRDGDLDLFVANYLEYDPQRLPGPSSEPLDRDEDAAFNPYLYPSEPDVLLRNEGNGTFTDVSAEAGITDPEGKGLGVVFVDLNEDGWPDIFVVNDVSADALYVNQGDGRFVEMGLAAGVADPRGGMGVAAADYDNDGYLDLFLTHWQDEANVLYRNLGPPPGIEAGPGGSAGFGDLLFEDVTGAVGLGRVGLGLTGWGTVFFDADQDGDLDIYLTNGYTSPSADEMSTCVPQPDRLLINEGGRFVDRSVELLKDVPVCAGRGLAAADLDDDGDLDLVRTCNNGPAVVLENRFARGHWLIVQPRGPLLVGTDVRLMAGGRRQRRVIQAGTSFLSCEPPEAHFGLGEATRVERLEVCWPDGRRRVWEDVPADRRFVAERPS